MQEETNLPRISKNSMKKKKRARRLDSLKGRTASHATSYMLELVAQNANQLAFQPMAL